jgi:hypothetical protein
MHDCVAGAYFVAFRRARARFRDPCLEFVSFGKRRPAVPQAIECEVALLHEQQRLEILEAHGPPPNAIVVCGPPSTVVGVGFCLGGFGFGAAVAGGAAVVAVRPVVGVELDVGVVVVSEIGPPVWKRN